MATVKCPECGSEISSEATVCIHCGSPVRVTLNGTVVKPSANPAPAKKSFAAGQTKTKKGIIISLVVILALIAGYIFVINPMLKIKSLKFPYGLSPDMGQSEAVKVMRDNGFISDNSLKFGSTIFFKSREIFGKYTENSLLYISNSKLSGVGHSYTDGGYDGHDPSPSFLKVKAELEKLYGSPEEKTDKDDWKRYVWTNGQYELTLRYVMRSEFMVSYVYHASKTK